MRSSIKKLMGIGLCFSSVLVAVIGLEVCLRIIMRSGYFQFSPKSGVRATYEYVYHVKKNSWGLRDREFTDEELQYSKILLLGDSMTFGQGVEAEDTFPRIVQREVSKVKSKVLVINGGGSGTSTIGQFESLKELSNEYRFCAVGFCFYLGNDSDNNYEDVGAGDRVKKVFQRKGQCGLVKEWLFKKSILFNFAYYRTKMILYKFKLLPAFQGQEQLKKRYTKRGRRGWEITSKVIRQIKEFCDNWSGKLFFVILPQDIQVDEGKQQRYRLDREVYDFLKPNGLIAKCLQEHEVPFIDVTEAFIKYYEEKPLEKLYYPIDRHLNRRGHELVGILLSDFLIDGGFVQDCELLK